MPSATELVVVFHDLTALCQAQPGLSQFSEGFCCDGSCTPAQMVRWSGLTWTQPAYTPWSSRAASRHAALNINQNW